ncbi:hypothetical protein GCM10027085_38720 [Spirosoma aerophilum]
MGQDKSLLDYHGKPQREHLTDLLKPYCKSVFWSVNADQAMELSEIKQPVIVDLYNLISPLNGILSAFQTDPSTAWLVVACDMPLLTARTFDALLMNRAADKMATVFYDSDGQSPEPLLGIYEPAFGPVLYQAFQNGAVSPRQLLLQNDVNMLTIPDRRELTNINDPEARVALKQRS